MRVARLTLTLGLTAILVAATASLTGAQLNTTVVLKNGQRHSGSNLAYRVDNRQVVVRTSQAEEPRIPVDQVAYVDFGGTSDPTNLNLSGSLEAVVLRDGSILKGQILELGHTNKADLSSPYLVIIRTEAGEERRLQSNQVARVYFAGGQPSGSGGSGGSGVTPPSGQDYTVSSQERWTPTGLEVRRGEPLNINASGEIRFGGGENMKATPTGSGDTNRENPLPNVPTGTLIGRVGNGQPFVIGNQTRVQAPAAGQLFLGINDSNLSDNQGSYRVEVRRVARSR
jgi:hypothetical protein